MNNPDNRLCSNQYNLINVETAPANSDSRLIVTIMNFHFLG